MEDLNTPPQIDYDKCTGCGKCVGMCPGLAIFLVKVNSQAHITLPYEFYPIPQVGEMAKALNRKGEIIGDAKIIKVKKINGCALITIEIDKGLEMDIRNIRVE
jgi:Fe-S-cluster-containing hydrogenase component 2